MPRVATLAVLLVAASLLTGCMTIGRENVGDRMTMDLAILGEGIDEPAIFAGLRARGYTVNEVTNAYLALASEYGRAHEALDAEPPPSWPPNAREVWRTGSAKRRALAKAGEWRHDEAVKRCAESLGDDVLRKLGEGHRAWRLVVVCKELDRVTVFAQPPGGEFYRQAHRDHPDDVDGIVGAVIEALNDQNVTHHNRTFTEPSHHAQ